MRLRYRKSKEDSAVAEAVAANFLFLISEWEFEIGRTECDEFFNHFEFVGKLFNIEIHIEKREREVDLCIATCDVSKPLTTLGVFEGVRVRKYLKLWLRDNHVELAETKHQARALSRAGIAERDMAFIVSNIELEASALSVLMTKIVSVANKNFTLNA
jgi:hypothetical protein